MSGSTMPFYCRWRDENPDKDIVGIDITGMGDPFPGSSAEWDDLYRRIGPSRPPFELMWVEADDAPRYSPGAYLVTTMLADGFSGDLQRELIRAVDSENKVANPEDGFAMPVNIEPGGSWTIVFLPLYHPDGKVVGVFTVALTHSPDGVVEHVSWPLMSGVLLGRGEDDEFLNDDIHHFFYWVLMAVFTGAVMHCKNVTTREEHLPRQLRRERERRGLADIVYRTLVVGPTPGQAGGKSAPKPEKTTRLHLCRGHFAEYGPDYGKGKLFGRLEGRYWVPPHVKGSAEIGRVEKTYRVEAA